MRRPHLTLRRQIAAQHVPRRHHSSAQLLGAGHPLARGDELRRDLWCQSSVTAAAGVLGASAYAAGRGWGLLLLVAAAIVQLGLGVALALHAGLQRERARELIIAGQEDLPLLVLQRERRRLRRPRRCRGLADAIEELLRAADRWPTLVPTCRPVFDPRLVRASERQLRAIAAGLRTASVTARAVARVERLLTSGSSPLYGRELEQLLRELRRTEAELESAESRPPAPKRQTHPG
jgi:hypothetical protein